MKNLVINILTNIMNMMLIVICFIIFNKQSPLLEAQILIKYINISSILFLAISIILFEIASRKGKGKLYIYGIEFLVLALFTLLIKHIPKILGCTMKTYTEVGMYAFIGYYILKSGMQYTIQKQNQLNSLSDIKEIVKEEPTRKATKRKNIKVEEGK